MNHRAWKMFFVCLTVSFIFICTTASISTAAEKKYPSGPIDLWQPFAPGGVFDNMNHVIAKKLSTYLGGTVVPQTKAGSGGALLASFLYNARPDGYTIGTLSAYHIGVPILQGGVPYSFKDFYFIGQVVVFPSCLFARADSPFKTFQDLVEHSRKNTVQWANNGFAATVTQRFYNLFKVLGMKIDPVPFKGGTEVNTAVLGKHVPLGSGAAGDVKGLVEAGKLRVLFSFENPTDFGLPPDTANTKSVFRGAPYVDIEPSACLVVSSKTPPEIIRTLEGAYAKLMKDEEYKKFIASVDLAMGYQDGKTFTEKLPAQIKILEEIMRSSGQLK
jgi:tripartite-type tricarboxylate transporter receptor subunit TctC